MTHILCLETATTNCSVALSINGNVVAMQEDNAQKYSHAERLHVFIKEVLDAAGITKDKLSAIAVSKGPGSYTGLRIGVSATKGLCAALDVPLISVDTLGALSRKLTVNDGELIIPMLDARRMEVYSAVFDNSGNRHRETQAQILDETSFTEYLDKGIVHFVGNGVEKFQEICEHPNARFVIGELPSSTQMASMAQTKFEANDLEDVAYFEPYYLKDFIAGKPKAK
ncbi:tRNA (adenosine(37)-N6)-threonylcarbamoyltransferase complex dimerization subunit type 1 TsaB [uncultured Dokdonia sp.]|uniref:tRNA (adenosine(37)-N6)-threonylcarbamoyltransferase complex dimerization subunit type 1 TsaB n=1 Tax=Dokdonia sp. R78006 TaxID=3093866 RepID=UPI002606825B|nr:tRNA (adenosine(37)-N6)-threonylcarbamoyltransferase complex dimerization subunit type 1 TsaB [uncultured Dokdonia sp.]